MAFLLVPLLISMKRSLVMGLFATVVLVCTCGEVRRVAYACASEAPVSSAETTDVNATTRGREVSLRSRADTLSVFTSPLERALLRRSAE